MIYSFDGYIPVVHPSAYVHPQAAVIGNVIIGKNVFVGPFAAIRGDFGQIRIGDGSNVQESCTIHMFPGIVVELGKNTHIGHGAVLHGATTESDVLIGMNSVIMDNCHIGMGSVVGAMTFVKADSRIPKLSLVVGNPGRIVGEVSEKMVKWKADGTKIYQLLPDMYRDTLRVCDPLVTEPENRPVQAVNYKTWKENVKSDLMSE